jgi:AcrR family transcriptional regulator
MERKPKRRTRERILETSLRLFNDLGAPSVTTAAIGDELNISPGNFYYHFRGKDAIVNTLFGQFERDLERVLAMPAAREADIEDIWLFLHVMFETIWRYRFLYRDLNDLLSHNRLLESHFKRLLGEQVRIIARLCEALAARGEMRVAPNEIEALAMNVVVVMTYWLAFEYARNPRNPQPSEIMARGAYQVMVLFAPFLSGRSRALFERLAAEYLR